MQNEQYKASDGTVYVRINKMRARNYYGSGKTILLVPDGMRDWRMLGIVSTLLVCMTIQRISVILTVGLMIMSIIGI